MNEARIFRSVCRNLTHTSTAHPRDHTNRMCGSRLFVADSDPVCVMPSLCFHMLVLRYLQQNLEDVNMEKHMRSFSPK